MFLLFEDDGVFKTGTLLTENDASLQVETAHGKRIKLKRAHILLSFREPSPVALLSEAEHAAEAIDIDFLWEVCGDDEFSFNELAAEYHGHVPSAVESAAILFRLHTAPIWFHRKGKGRYRKAPPEILQAALAGMEKKRQQAETMEQIRATLVEGRLPEELASLLPQALYRPDRNRIEIKALEAACVDTGLSVPHLLLKCGALTSSHDYHYNRFLFEYFPEGYDFPPCDPPVLPDTLPIADVRAFSLDDASTTEIDDAFSITPRPQGGWLIGIHIAVPGLGFPRGSSLDTIARERLSTVYMPGKKITMLPPTAVEAFTLQAGHTPPAISLYLTVNPDLSISSHETRLERVPIAANLRHHDIEPLFNDHTLHNGGPDFPWKSELSLLWDLTTVLEAGRGKPAANQNIIDYNFAVDWNVMTSDGPGHITIGQRMRGSPIDSLVSELMIFTNSTWGKLLDQAGIPGVYRVQSGGKVRMSTAAGPHEGLGVDCYAWSSSPLRRYIDLINQWQIIAALNQSPPSFAPKSADLMGIIRDFEVTYTAYAEFQRQMERYWCLRWLRQSEIKTIEAKVVRDNFVRLETIPLGFKVPSLPFQLPGSRIQLALESIDLLDLEIQARYICTLAEPDPETYQPGDFDES